MKYLPIVLSVMMAGVLSVSCSEDNNPVVAVEPTAEEGFIEINGGGASFPNMVFVNLSEEEQVAVPRESWDLSFTNGSGFEVLINGTTGAMAYPTGKQTFEEVEAETMEMLRTEGKLVLDFNNMVSRRYVDDPNNPWVNGTAIQPVSANMAENQVYIYSRGESGAAERPWVLLRVDRESNAYKLTYKEVGGTERSAVIAKGSDTHMNYFSFTADAVVQVEPARKKWDFVWTAGTNEIRFLPGRMVLSPTSFRI
ncbi:HmuY family protein [Nitritalea halalkaliphila]|uniref:HmuY family protein n=1 Tax=Nitritalea halalkaliphila TaxID=590849 RepID=UPI0002EFD6EA|nr:HmuY family protein [Nitritalea halalkaliphila]